MKCRALEAALLDLRKLVCGYGMALTIDLIGPGEEACWDGFNAVVVLARDRGVFRRALEPQEACSEQRARDERRYLVLGIAKATRQAAMLLKTHGSKFP